MNERPDIFAYVDFKEYLRDLYSHLKSEENGFSHRKFALRAGLSAPNALKRVMDGERSLPSDSITKFSDGLRLTGSERKFFRDLVKWNQAGNQQQRKYYESKVKRASKALTGTQLDEDIYEYLSNWYVVVLRELLGIPGCPSSSNELATLLRPVITEDKVENALALLTRLGLVTNEHGSWKSNNEILETRDEVSSIAAKNYHRSMINFALTALDIMPTSERVLGGITSTISEDRWPDLLEILSRQREEMTDFLDSGTVDSARKVIQINYSAVSMSKTVGSETEKC